MSKSRLALAATLVILISVFFSLGLDSYLTLEAFRAQQSELQTLVNEQFGFMVAAFFGIYVAVTALSIPGAAVMTLAAGALFGLLSGTIIVSFASTLGATLAFLLARFLFRSTVKKRFASTIERIDTGIDKEGAYYLFTLRLVPIFPFFAINLAMALTRLRTLTFALISQIGMLPGTIVYVNAGTQLGRIESTADIASPALIGSFVLLGLFPLLTKKILGAFNTRKIYQRFTKPKHFDANLVVIGAGAAGLVTSYIAAASKAKVFLIEKNRMGGDCLNTGCVPSKALIRTASIAADIRRASEYGLHADNLRVDFPKVMQRVKAVIADIEPHDSIERYTALGVDCITGAAKIESPWTVRVNDQTITTRNIVIASGGEPFVPPIPGLERIDYLTSDNLWDLQTLPQRLVVLGGGPIGCEMAQAFRRLGSEVTMVEMAPRILVREDEDVAAAVTEKFSAEGIQVLTGYAAEKFTAHDSSNRVTCTQQTTGDTKTIEFDQVLVAVGRKARTEGFGLDTLGIEKNPNGTIAVNDYLQTNYPNIFACGDVAGPYQLTHAAGHQGWYCAMNALFGRFWKFRVDYSVMPWAVFTDPEVARVGINEDEARAQNIPHEVTRYGIDDLDRAIADNTATGFVKVLTPPGSDKILGVTIVGPHAGDLIAEFVTTMRAGLGLKKILNAIHIYPTLAESNKYVAGEWQKAHLPKRLIGVSHWLNARMRG